ncbi:MAG: flagellar hook-basal body complex protein FliE [Pseudomonadales bacterium]|uniref:Flagellar hook-basal body complex protein FliE n=1 Tax=Oleiphilus messinensis TaxID=141451 RepID=A0A1Y0IAU5_9GAMM|nr:flagellar hook-basal body complex protein FliE [Oleiphilus messinensis]ARU57591.1 flagellar hook-basal body complex protein FliE [Oleiphilus messinensis]MCG8612442.1 flagellar hook-basal body complex protein FliE [Pseudomonadales bacterium]
MTERNDITQVLAEMRTLRAQIQRPKPVQPDLNPNKINEVNKPSDVPSFGDMLTSAVNKVNDTQKTAKTLATAYEQGDPQVDIARVMVAGQKASVSFQALTQVRNKVVQAYEEIMKMPV